MSDETIKVPGREMLGFDFRPDNEYKVKTYDFKRPDKFALDQIRTIHMMHETFARRAALTLSEMTHESVEINVRVVDQLCYHEFIEGVQPGGALAIVNMKPLRGNIAVELTETVASRLVHSVCGGSGDNVETGEFSELSTLALTHAGDRLLSHLAEAWAPVLGLTASVAAVETKAESAQIVPPSEMIVMVGMEVKIGDETGALRIVMPFLTIEPVIHKLSAQYWFSKIRRGSQAEVVGQAVVRLDLPMEIAYGTEPICLAELKQVCAGRPVKLMSAGDAALYLGSVPVATLAAPPQEVHAKEYRRFAVLNAPAPQLTPRRSAEDTVIPRIDEISRKIDQLFGDVRSLSDSQRVLTEDLASEAVPERGVALTHTTTRHAEMLARQLVGERHQVIAFVLSLLPPEVAAAVIATLDPEIQPDVVERLIRSGDTDAIFRDRVSVYLSRLVSRQLSTARTGGPEAVAEILNHVPRSVERHVMDDFQHRDKELFESVAQLMFVFEDFVLVDKAAIRKVMERVTNDEMAMAMKDIPDDVARHILGALEADAASALEDAIGRLGRVRRRDVETAQREVIEELAQLDKAGEVVIARPGEVID